MSDLAGVLRLFAVYFCTLYQHNLWLVFLAAAICVITATSGLSLLRRGWRLGAGRWALTAGAVTGFGIWSTHFVAMLGYMPSAAMDYRFVPTFGSLMLAMMMMTASFATAYRRERGRNGWWAGLIAGGGVAAMHYLGTSALDAPVKLAFRTDLVVASLVLAVVPFGLALRWAQGGRALWQQVALATVAVSGLHFTGMAAIRLTPARVAHGEGLLIAGPMMALVVGVAACGVLGVYLLTLAMERRVQSAIHRSERDFSILAKGISDCALYMLTSDGYVANWNAGAARLKGYTDEEAIGLPLAKFYTPEERVADRPAEALGIAARTGKFTGEGWRCRKDGSRFWAHVTIERISDAEGRQVGFAKITRDMTRWKADQDRLAAMKAQLDTALDNMHQGLALFDAKGRLVLCNQRLAQIWGVENSAALVGLSLRALLGRMMEARQISDPAAIRAALEQAMADTPLPVEITCDEGLVVSVATRPLPEGGWVSTFEDITEKRRHEAQLAHLAQHDALTGLANRAYFAQWCAREIDHAERHQQKLAMVAINMDRFKDINDTWGHAEGDKAICAVAERLAHACGEGEQVARLGGDEFAAAKMYTDEAELSAFVARIAACFDQPVGAPDSPVPVAASFGVALFPTDAQDRETLLSNADLAMHRAKANFGEAICYYQPDMDESARYRRQIAADLRHAIERGELYLLYQPQHNVESGALTGYEALLRWEHPVRGMINPMDFISIAEETGDIFAIGEWVLREAAREATGWADHLRVAVNLSPVQLLQSDLLPKIMAVLLETGLPARRLELEITESAIIADKARALHLLRQIKALGIAIAMDDFGTGYSSLDTLHSFPFDKIKIDKSFLQQSSDSPQAAAIVRAVLALGRSLGIPVLAEGVETVEQLELLKRERCDDAQGYFYGRPQAIGPEARQHKQG